MKSIRLVVFLVVAALAVTGAIFVRSVVLERRFPQAITHLAATGEPLEVDGLTISVESATLLEGQQVAEYLNGYQPVPGYPDSSTKMILVDIHVSNLSSNVETFRWLDGVLRSGAWANGFDAAAMRAVQPELSWETSLEPGAEIFITLTSLLLEWSVDKNDWDSVGQLDYTLDFLQYPNYYRLTLPELRYQ